MREHDDEIARRIQDVEARFTGLINAAVDAIIVIDRHGHIETFNPAAERIFAGTAAEVIGRNVSCLMPEPDSGRHDSYLHNYLTTKMPKIIGVGREVVGRRLTGELFPMDLSVGEVGSPDGKKFVGIVRDTTQRQAMIAALQDREEDLRLVVDNAPGGIFTADIRGTFLSTNPALLKLAKHSASSLVGANLVQFVVPEDRPILETAIAAALANPNFPQFVNVAGLRGDGERLYVMIQLSVVTHTHEAPLLIGQVVDRTPQFAAEARTQDVREQLARVSRLTTLGEMASAIAHEINQPLTAIATQAQTYQRLLSANKTDSGAVAMMLGEVAEHALRIGEIIKRIRAFVTQRETSQEHVDVNSVIREMLPLSMAAAREAEVHLEMRLGTGLPLVVLDPIQFQQVCLNLIQNAIDAMVDSASDAREVILTTAARDGQVEVSIEDTGPGVPPVIQSQLFIPFFTTKLEGMGMGLAICDSIVSAHNGSLRYGDRVGGGARFVVTLPAAL